MIISLFIDYCCETRLTRKMKVPQLKILDIYCINCPPRGFFVFFSRAFTESLTVREHGVQGFLDSFQIMEEPLQTLATSKYKN